MGVRHFTKTHAFINLINFCLTTNIKKSTKSFPLWYLFYSSVNLMWNIMNHWKTSWIIRFIIQLKFFKGTSNETNKRSLLSVHPLAFIIFCKYVFFVNWTYSIVEYFILLLQFVLMSQDTSRLWCTWLCSVFINGSNLNKSQRNVIIKQIKTRKVQKHSTVFRSNFSKNKSISYRASAQ